MKRNEVVRKISVVLLAVFVLCFLGVMTCYINGGQFVC